MHITKHAVGLIVATALLGSCSTPKNITYFPELHDGSVVRAEKVLEVTARPKDRLSVRVSTQSEKLSGQFNPVTSAGGDSQGASYTVDSNGDINFPALGRVHVAGLTREQVAGKLEDMLKADLVKDAMVAVEFANTGFSVLGEVKSPGRYDFSKDRLTIIDAIAIAGDLTMDGMRENILVLRSSGDGRQEAYRVNLLNATTLASSPVFYLQQDDVIYVEPNDKAKRETTASGNTPYTPSFWISLGTIGMTLTSLIVTLTR